MASGGLFNVTPSRIRHASGIFPACSRAVGTPVATSIFLWPRGRVNLKHTARWKRLEAKLALRRLALPSCPFVGKSACAAVPWPRSHPSRWLACRAAAPDPLPDPLAAETIRNTSQSPRRTLAVHNRRPMRSAPSCSPRCTVTNLLAPEYAGTRMRGARCGSRSPRCSKSLPLYERASLPPAPR